MRIYQIEINYNCEYEKSNCAKLIEEVSRNANIDEQSADLK